ncbi:YqgE/AlgH family protein [Kribbella sp. NBC_01245]|uniref:YqgE/AlgH family protein n=1 Tax=Kribbella sp. NBC_01245 TaxID=2903578 RepID=UPI002E2E0309|nr:YqgE/AlgH family protein [Kribbella sp. NBC_01245]
MTATTLTGSLLVATPILDEPPFRRAVILLLDHDDDGALGVVVNRAADLEVDRVLADWSDSVSEPGVLFMGGPVGTDSALAVAEITDQSDPPGWRECFGRIGLLDLDAPPALLAGAIRRMRIFAGYSGWGSGQLEDEITEGAWYVVPSEPDDVFSLAPETLWRRVLRRQRDEMALLATYPDDPSHN